MELEPGTIVVDRFRLERIVGSGGMGVVWAATELATGTVRALKFLKSSEGHAHARLIREARAASKVRHPNVASVLEVLELPTGQPFLVMELLVGETLATRLERGALSQTETSRLFLQIISAVEAAHLLKIVHRDLKPDNVFLLGSEVRVLDFGIAKDVSKGIDDTDSASLTATGAMLGTPYYMAPEQIFGDSDIDARADIWAIGVMIYECLSGRRPTQGTGVGQVLKIIATDGIVPLSEGTPGAPRELSDLLARMLTRDRSKRPGLIEVKSVLSQLRGDALVTTPSRPVDQPTLDTTEKSIAPTKTRSRPLRSALVIAGMASVGGLVVFAIARNRPAQPQDVRLEAATPEIIAEPEAAALPTVDAETKVVVTNAASITHIARPPLREAGADATIDAGIFPPPQKEAGSPVRILSHDRM